MEGKRSKLNTLINYPLSGLDLNKFLSVPNQRNSAEYDLYSVISHQGSLLSGNNDIKYISFNKIFHYSFACKILNSLQKIGTDEKRNID